jgi:hypothetical protein
VSQRSICNLHSGITAKTWAWTELMLPSSVEPAKLRRNGLASKIAGASEAKIFHVPSRVDPGPSGFDWPHD